MTDERLGPPRGRLDDAIDRTVHAMVHRDAPSAIRGRVVAQLAERPPAEPAALRAWPEPRRLAWAAASVALIAGVALMAPRWREQSEVPAPQTAADLTSKSPAPPSDAAGTALVPAARVAGSGPAGAVAVRSLGPARGASATASLAERVVRPPFIDPLSAPDPIVIAALETERVTAEGVDIQPMSFEPLRIEPIHEQR